MIKIAKVHLKNGQKMTALNTSKHPDFIGYLVNSWAWKGVEKIEADELIVEVSIYESLFKRLSAK